MTIIRRSAGLALLCLVATASACLGQQGSENPHVNIFEPREYGTHDRPDAGDDHTVEPDAEFVPEAGVRPASDYPWLPQDRPIRFHTREESEANRATWQPYEEMIGEPDTALVESRLSIDFWYPRDANLAHLATTVAPNERFRQSPPYVGPGQDDVRGRFIGLGEPFADDHLHMFETDGVNWMGNYLVTTSIGGINVAFLKSENTPADPEAVESGLEPGLPPRFWSWFDRIRPRDNGNLSQGVRLPVYLVFTQSDAHAVTQRRVRWYARLVGGHRDDRWYFQASIPDEFEQ